jgi:NAD(P)H-nitrite reductase large subunit
VLSTPRINQFEIGSKECVMLNDGEKGVVIQRDRESYAVAPHLPCGIVTPEVLRKLADAAEKYHAKAIKVTSAARIALVGVKEEDIDAIWADLGMAPGRVVGICVRSIKACPGTTFCKRGQQDSLALGMQLDEKYHGTEMPGKMKLGVSGCPNQCGETNFKDIGLVGTSKGWRVYVGGNGGANPRLGEMLLPQMDTEQVLPLVEKIIDYYRASAKPKERLGKTIERLGLEHLKGALGLSSDS